MNTTKVSNLDNPVAAQSFFKHACWLPPAAGLLVAVFAALSVDPYLAYVDTS